MNALVKDIKDAAAPLLFCSRIVISGRTERFKRSSRNDNIVARWSGNSSVRNHEAVYADFDRGEINPREARSFRDALEFREGVGIT